VDLSVLYISCVLGNFVLDYDFFVQKIKFTCNTCEFINPTIHIFFYIIVYFLFCKILYIVGTSEGNSYISLFKYIGNIAH